MLYTKKLLEQCQLRLIALDSQVDRIRSNSVGNKQLSDVLPLAPPPSPASIEMSVDSQKRAAPRCHECHGPLAPYHKGYPHGVDTCELEHYDLCCGGITEGNDKGGHFWKCCPADFTPHPELENAQMLGGSNISDAGLEFKSVSGSQSDSDYDPGSDFLST
jgi:hypothetical protein